MCHCAKAQTTYHIINPTASGISCDGCDYCTSTLRSTYFNGFYGRFGDGDHLGPRDGRLGVHQGEQLQWSHKVMFRHVMQVRLF